MGYVSETGRIVYGSGNTYALTADGRRSTYRPLDEKGRWLSYLVEYEETVDFTTTIAFSPAIESESTTCDNCWDLRKLMPRKFQDAPVLMEFLNAVSQVVNSVACRIATLSSLGDVDVCPKRYLGHLGALIDYQLKNTDYASTAELRRQLETAIEMYKIKGTYAVLDLAFYILGLTVKVYDLWTQDYLTFERQLPHKHTGILSIYGGWTTVEDLHCDDGHFMDETTPAGGSGASAPWHFDGGLGFKSPHFDLIVTMDKLIYFQGYYQKLFVAEYWNAIFEIVEEFTPINTVPHYYQELFAYCLENFEVYTVADSQVKTTILDKWTVATLYLDDGSDFDVHEVDPAIDPTYLDQSFLAMVNNLTVIKLGDGNVGGTPDHTDTALGNIVWTGTVSSINVAADKITYLAQVPSTVDLSDVTEMGLFLAAAPTEMYVESFFPAFDKPEDVLCDIRIEIERKKA